MTIHNLSKSYVSRDGAPKISRVDKAIFVRRYFTHCLKCDFCHDSCCSYGVDVDEHNVERILSRADDLEPLVGVPRNDWFESMMREDPEFPGGRHTRTKVVDGRCVFLDREQRGCILHRYCVETGADYHDIKPMVSSLYPVTFNDGLLHPSEEVVENLLVCLDQGPSIYRGVRHELGFYFGLELLDELDGIERNKQEVFS